MRILAGMLAGLLSLGTPVAGGLPSELAGALASANVEFVMNVPQPGAMGARILDDLMYVTSKDGLRIYDVSDPSGIPIPKGALPLPHYSNEDVDTNGEILLVVSDHAQGILNMLYVVDVSDPSRPMLLSQLMMNYPYAHTASCVHDCSYAWVAGDAYISVVDLRNPAAPVEAGRFFADGTDNPDASFGWTHDVQIDEAGIAWISAVEGLFAFDLVDPIRPTPIAERRNGSTGAFDNTFTLHNSLRPHATATTPEGLADDEIGPGEVVLVTSEDWLTPDNQLCATEGSFQTGWVRQVDGSHVVERLDSVRLGRFGSLPSQKPQPVATCSSHYFDHRDDGIVAVAWYEQGTRFLDVSDPRNIRQVGYFLPLAGEAWSALWHGDVLYTFDRVRGIDVLRFTGGPGDPEIESPPLQPATGSVEPSERFGFACRLV
jgi:hypothetical protein